MDWTYEMEMGDTLSWGNDDPLAELVEHYEVGKQIPKPEPNPDPDPKAERLMDVVSLWPEIEESRVELTRHVELIFGAELATDGFDFDVETAIIGKI